MGIVFLNPFDLELGLKVPYKCGLILRNSASLCVPLRISQSTQITPSLDVNVVIYI